MGKARLFGSIGVQGRGVAKVLVNWWCAVHLSLTGGLSSSTAPRWFLEGW